MVIVTVMAMVMVMVKTVVPNARVVHLRSSVRSIAGATRRGEGADCVLRVMSRRWGDD